MVRRERAGNDQDEMILSRAIDRDSVSIAVNQEQRRRLNDFYEIFVRPPQLHYFDGRTNLAYETTRFSGVSRNGTLVTVRSRLRQPGDIADEQLTLVVVGSLDTDETMTVTDNYSESHVNYDGTATQSIVIGETTPEASNQVLIDDFSNLDVVGKDLQDYRDFGTAPQLTYEHGRWTYRRHDGYEERLSDLRRVHAEVMATARKLGAVALPSGQYDQKVVV